MWFSDLNKIKVNKITYMKVDLSSNILTSEFITIHTRCGFLMRSFKTASSSTRDTPFQKQRRSMTSDSSLPTCRLLTARRHLVFIRMLILRTSLNLSQNCPAYSIFIFDCLHVSLHFRENLYTAFSS